MQNLTNIEIENLEKDKESLKEELLKKKEELNGFEKDRKEKEDFLYELLKDKTKHEEKKDPLLKEKKEIEKKVELIKKREKQVNKEKDKIEKKESEARDEYKKREIERERWKIVDKRRLIEDEKWEFQEKIINLNDQISKIDETIKRIEERRILFEENIFLPAKKREEKLLKEKQEKEKRINEIDEILHQDLENKARKEKESEEELVESIKQKAAEQQEKEKKTYQKERIIGIDISDYSIEVMQLSKQKEIVAYGRSVLKEGIVDNGEIIKQEELIQSLKETLKNAKPSPFLSEQENKEELKAVISLPESKTYIQYLNFKDNNNLKQKVKKEIEKNVPLLIDKVHWDFLEIQDAKVISASVNQEIINSYNDFLQKAEIVPIVFDVESNSTARSLLPRTNIENNTGDSDDVVVLDIGARTTNIIVCNNFGIMCSAATVPYAGYVFTEKIMKHLNVSWEEAEKLKKEKGLYSTTEFFFALSEELLRIVNETKEAVDFYKKNFERDIKKIIIVGGSALLPEINNFFQKFLNIKVETGNPLLKIKNNEILEEKQKVFYSNVIGLALRGISDNPSKNGLNLLSINK